VNASSAFIVLTLTIDHIMLGLYYFHSVNTANVEKYC